MRKPNTYRADIDGLRSVAVISVILCHFGNYWFPGGFLGVDVFFVISGYLIIGKLHADIGAGRFNLHEFYIRRLRRLFPAMLATVLLCYLLFAAVMPPPDFRQQAQSSAFAIASLANVYFYLKTGYFDTAAVFNPLLHLWSLGVEEQFYLVMPVVALALLRWAPALFWPLLALAALASLIGAELVYDRDPSLVYYMLPFRAFELMIGGLIHPIAARVKPRGAAADGLFALGLALIAVAVFTMDETTRIPGVAALVPCLGAALTIWTGAEALRTRRLLTSAPMLWIGMISYSLYLVHWPAVSFWRYLTSQEWTALDQAGVILASLAAAAVMHRFVETPFRHMPAGGGGGRWKANRGFVAGCALVAGLGIAPGVAERFRIGHDWEDMSGIAAFQGMTGAPAMRQASVSVAGGGRCRCAATPRRRRRPARCW
jgi:peptidoglycan/LPS O-acetylase OafA/YrhL